MPISAAIQVEGVDHDKLEAKIKSPISSSDKFGTPFMI